MSRYIDADKLKSEFDYEHIDMNKTAAFIHHCHILEIINQQPTADVVEVVRCKNCKHRKKNTFCLHNMRYEDDNGFCSYGERGKYEKNN